MSSTNVLLLLPEAENPDRVYDRELSRAFPAMSFHSVTHHEKVDELAARADVLMTFSPFMADHVLKAASRLKWIQVLGSGLDGIINLPSLRRDVIITSGRGVQAGPVSEAALALMFAVSRDLPRMVLNQMTRSWVRWPSQLLEGRTLGILGVGQIGEVLGRKASALGMRVIGISSGVRDVDGLSRIYPLRDLQTAVAEVDYLVILTPYSVATHHIVDARVLGAMRPGAFLINVARGGVVDETALLEALRSGKIRGAALDVFSQEPLPVDSELWQQPNVLISPHLGGLNSDYPGSILPLLVENLGHFEASRFNQMRNMVVPAAAEQ